MQIQTMPSTHSFSSSG